MKVVFVIWILLSSAYQYLSARTPVNEAPAVRQALAYLQKVEPETIAEQIRICEIPAPPFKEQARIDYIKRRFTELGLQNVRVDSIGNVIGEYRGDSGKPTLALSAHLDTVFPEGTEIKVVRDGSVLRAPGISDDARGLAVILAVARALQHTKIKTQGDILFVATVGEEGLGNLRGVRHLFQRSLKDRITDFISVDGVGLGAISIPVGSNRYRVTFHGAGGHSYNDFGIPNPLHALGRAIAGIADFQVPAHPKATFSVGRVGGGTSVNSIAYTAWMEVDLRSEDAAELAKLDAAFHRAVFSSLREENGRWRSDDTLTVEIESLGERPLGRLPDDAEILQAVRRADQALGIETRYHSGSTDSNLPISLGIPALTLCGGGSGSHKHSLQETFDTRDSHLGTQRALLTVLEIVGVVK